VGATGGDDDVNQDNKLNRGTDWREGHRIATYAVELVDHGPEPDWHLDRTVFARWARYELVARNLAGDELARARGYGNADCWYRLAGELRSAMHWIR
jgi:hypothetical protein